MIRFPNCKINLGLTVVRKRPDGFHDIETVFYPVPLFDVLEVVPSRSGKSSFQCTGLEIPGDPYENLAWQACKLLNEDQDLPTVDVYLLKNIPMGAGLGGGSADAAFMLKLLSDLFELELPDTRLIDYARQLGADCAFFIRNRPVLAYGKGDVFENIDLDLSGYHIAIVKPDIHIDTKMAYAGVSPSQPDQDIKDILQLDLSEWKANLKNDFEAGIFKQHPLIRKIKEELYEKGALYAAMSGSGSAVYGLFRQKPGPDDLPNGIFRYVAEL